MNCNVGLRGRYIFLRRSNISVCRYLGGSKWENVTQYEEQNTAEPAPEKSFPVSPRLFFAPDMSCLAPLDRDIWRQMSGYPDLANLEDGERFY